MPQVILSPKAARDFDRLRKFLHTKSPEAAARAVSTLRAALRRLAQHPLAQTPHPGNPAFRTLQVPFGSSGYTVWYHYLPGGDITIVALKHQREGGFDNDEGAREAIMRASTARLAFLQEANESLRQYHETGVHLTQAEMDAGLAQHLLSGLAAANAGDLIPALGMESQARAERELTRQRLEIGFHLELDDLLTQLDHWITDRTR